MRTCPRLRVELRVERKRMVVEQEEPGGHIIIIMQGGQEVVREVIREMEGVEQPAITILVVPLVVAEAVAVVLLIHQAVGEVEELEVLELLPAHLFPLEMVRCL